MTTTKIVEPFIESSEPNITAVVTDGDGLAVPVGQLLTLVLWLFDRASGTAINGRTAQSVLNLNGVTVDAQGNLKYKMEAADTIIVGTPTEGLKEEHVAMFEWTYNDTDAVERTGRHRIIHDVQQSAS